MSFILELGLPGLVFLGLLIWLVRKVLRAARTERDLEDDRLRGAFADELRRAKEHAAAVGAGTAPPLPRPAPAPSRQPAASPKKPYPALAPDPGLSALEGADLASADPAHLQLVAEAVSDRQTQLRTQHPGASSRRIEVLWIRSTATHCAWCERRYPSSAAALARDVICIAQISGGKVVDRWSFG